MKGVANAPRLPERAEADWPVLENFLEKSLTVFSGVQLSIDGTHRLSRPCAVAILSRSMFNLSVDYIGLIGLSCVA